MRLSYFFHHLSMAIKYPSYDTCHDIASDAETSTDELNRLAEHPDCSIRLAVARNESTSANTLCNLALDEYDLIRETIAEKMYTPVTALESLSKDSNQWVRDTALYTLNKIQTAQTIAKTNATNAPEV